VDFIFPSPYEREAIARGRNVTIGDKSCFASPEDLVIIRSSPAGRDLRMFGPSFKNRDIDIGHIRAWLKDFDSASTTRTSWPPSRRSLKEVFDLPALTPISGAFVLARSFGRVVGRNLETNLAAGNNPTKNPYPK
jgi:hypothetical protein